MISQLLKVVFASILLDIVLCQQQSFTWSISSANNTISENTPFSINCQQSSQITEVRVDVTDSNNLINVICNQPSSTLGACDTFKLLAFSQNPSSWRGCLYLSSGLDYLKNKEYKIALSASTNPNVFMSFEYINILVTRGYERPPVFTGNPNVQINEQPTVSNQNQIIQYQAKVGDINVNYTINYRIIEGPYTTYFNLDQYTGRMTNARPLTYSDPVWSNGFITITVEAALVINGLPQWANSNTSSRVFSTITLLDQNSFPPVFNQPSYTGFVLERIAPNTILYSLDIIVTDQDFTPINSRFRLYLDGFRDAFGVSPDVGTKSLTTHIVVLNSSGFDYDYGRREYSFNIIAVETNSTAPRSSSAAITIILQQVNKYEPVFVPTDLYTETIAENFPKSSQILKVQAIDRDVGPTFGNQSIRYKFIEGSSNLIKLDFMTGVISTSSCGTPGVTPCIDYERPENRFFNLKIAAYDKMGEGKSAIAQVLINVTNVNDNAPIFTSAIYYAEITDGNNFLNIPLPNIRATDADDDVVTYSIVSGNTPDNVWSINKTTANLSVSRNIAYSDTPSYNGFFLLYVNASDKILGYTTQCAVNITVKPVNRYTPQFNSSYYSTSISETTPAGALVYTIIATDADFNKTPGGRLVYRIGSGGQDKFDIDPLNGEVRVRFGSTFVFDITPQYNLTIFASDQGNPSFSNSTLLIVNITPYKPGPDFGVSTIIGPAQKETNPVTQYVMKVLVSDRDLNPRLIYSFNNYQGFDKNGVPVQLNATDNNMFVIDSSNGDIRIGSPLDYQRIAKWQAIIKCVDYNSDKKLSSTATFIIGILPVNKLPPVFTLPWTISNMTYTVTLPQSMNQLQYPIGTFLATSPDPSLQIKYSLISNPGYFRLNSTSSGSIYLNQILDFNRNQNLQVILVATDNGDPPLTSYATITVILKKEKSTDCDSALIPLLCVHG